MNIQIDGTNTKNKGAELMLHGILDQISRVYPKAEVYFNTYYGKLGEIDTSINLKKRKLLFSAYPDAILKKIGFKTTIFSVFHTHKKLDIVFDASGFRFGDQWNHSSYYNDRLQNYMSNLKKNETKIIFLPQAFGPFKTLQGSRSAKIINDYADIIIARESLSQNYLLEAGVDENKVRVNTDFT
ncbi:MAG: polysaccharide pyruvyl transferase family protein, partial [Candidatus Paceibacterota bacterium]